MEHKGTSHLEEVMLPSDTRVVTPSLPDLPNTFAFAGSREFQYSLKAGGGAVQCRFHYDHLPGL